MTRFTKQINENRLMAKTVVRSAKPGRIEVLVIQPLPTFEYVRRSFSDFEYVLVYEDYTNADIRNTLVNVRLYIEIFNCL